MGVMINLYCDEQIVTPTELTTLVEGMQSIVKHVLNKQDVFAFSAETSNFRSSDPVELFVQINGFKITDADGVADGMGEAISTWRRETNFPHPINLNVIPVKWHPRLGL